MVDKYELVPEILKDYGLVKNQLHSFNYFVETKFKKIVLGTEPITSTVDPTIYLRYLNVHIGVLSHRPQECRLSDRTYDAPILVNIEYTETQKRKKMIKEDVTIGRMPIMLRSCRCVLNGKDEDKLTYFGECPFDTGGYFVVRGTEKVILIQEQP